MNRKQLIDKLQVMAEKTGSQLALAQELGISPSYLNDVLQGNRRPGKGILKALQLEAKTTYRPRVNGQQGAKP